MFFLHFSNKIFPFRSIKITVLSSFQWCIYFPNQYKLDPGQIYIWYKLFYCSVLIKVGFILEQVLFTEKVNKNREQQVFKFSELIRMLGDCLKDNHATFNQHLETLLEPNCVKKSQKTTLPQCVWQPGVLTTTARPANSSTG